MREGTSRAVSIPRYWCLQSLVSYLPKANLLHLPNPYLQTKVTGSRERMDFESLVLDGW